MSVITYRDSQGRIIKGHRKKACQHLEDWAGSGVPGDGFRIHMDEYGIDFEPDEEVEYDEDGFVIVPENGWYLRWEQVRDFEATGWSYPDWDDFIHEYEKSSRAPRLVLMDSGEVYEFAEGNGDFVRAFGYYDDFVEIADATEEERGLLPENLPLGARCWPVRWGDFADCYERLHEVVYEDFRPGVYYSEV